MCFFLVVQIFYACRVYYLAYYPRERLIQLGVRFFSSIIAIILCFIVLKEKVQALFVISVVYYLNMILSIVFLGLHFREGLWIKILMIGLISFSLCDVSIGLGFVVDIFNLSNNNIICKILNFPINYVNVFYPLSQIIIAVGVMIKDK